MGLFDVACERVVYPLWARREGRDAAALSRELGRRQFDDAEVVRVRQRAALRRLLRFAAASVPHYRDLFARLRLTAEDIDSPEAFESLPILTKSDVRNHAARLCSEWAHGPRTRKRTSGSTGVPLEVRLDARGLVWKRACTLRADEWSGWRRGQSVAKVWGNPEYRQFGIKGWLRNRLYDRAVHLDTLKMHPDEVRRFARLLHRTRPALLFGTAPLAATENRGGLRLPGHQPLRV
jgi:phenylacetate-CoA ligase